jgi:hypothetical protein
MLRLGAAVLIMSCACGSAGFAVNGLTCATSETEVAVYDYASDAFGYETIQGALDAFRHGDTWPLSDDWHRLTQEAEPDALVAFKDECGWIHLSVELMRGEDGWLVAGFESCPP